MRFHLRFSDFPKSLNLLIERTQAVLNCDTKKTEMRDAFKKLIDELKTMDKKEMGQGTLILWGALFYRYFSLIKEYEKYNNSFFIKASGFQSSVNQCPLFTSIGVALNFTASDPCKVVNESTIIKSLESFKNYMLQADGMKRRYESYPDYDQDFESDLNTLIGIYKKREAQLDSINVPEQNLVCNRF